MGATHVVTCIVSLGPREFRSGISDGAEAEPARSDRAQKTAHGGLPIEHSSVYSSYRYLLRPRKSFVRIGGGGGVLK